MRRRRRTHRRRRNPPAAPKIELPKIGEKADAPAKPDAPKKKDTGGAAKEQDGGAAQTPAVAVPAVAPEGWPIPMLGPSSSDPPSTSAAPATADLPGEATATGTGSTLAPGTGGKDSPLAPTTGSDKASTGSGAQPEGWPIPTLGPASTDAPPGSSDGITTTTGAAPTRTSAPRVTTSPDGNSSTETDPSTGVVTTRARAVDPSTGSVTTRSSRTDPADRSRTTQVTTRSADASAVEVTTTRESTDAPDAADPSSTKDPSTKDPSTKDPAVEGFGCDGDRRGVGVEGGRPVRLEVGGQLQVGGQQQVGERHVREVLVVDVVRVLEAVLLVGLEEVDVLGEVEHLEGLRRVHGAGDDDVRRQRQPRHAQERHELERRLADDVRVAVLERQGRVLLGHVQPVVRGDVGHGGMVVTALGVVSHPGPGIRPDGRPGTHHGGP